MSKVIKPAAKKLAFKVGDKALIKNVSGSHASFPTDTPVEVIEVGVRDSILKYRVKSLVLLSGEKDFAKDWVGVPALKKPTKAQLVTIEKKAQEVQEAYDAINLNRPKVGEIVKVLRDDVWMKGTIVSDDRSAVPYLVELKQKSGEEQKTVWLTEENVKRYIDVTVITEKNWNDLVAKIGFKNAKKALKRQKKNPLQSNDAMLTKVSAAKWLLHSFNWKSSKEGYDFWCDLYNKMDSAT